jgi:hypothetical protein
VKITVPQPDTCLQKAREWERPGKVACKCVFFNEETLAASSVRGTKTKTAHEAKIINATIS